MRRERRRLRLTGHPSRDRWIIPYADFVTLLFAFFTALYAVTSVDASRLPTVAKELHDSLTGTQSSGLLPAHDALVGAEQADAANGDAVRAAIERELKDDLLANRLEVVEDRRGLVLAIPEAFAFELGRDDLSPAAQSLMTRVAKVLSELPNAVRVEGHTDNSPIHTPRFDSNWELSTARATRVVAFFITSAGLPPDRLSAAGYSQFHPRAANDTVDGRARNRRVDIVILNAATRASEEPAVPGYQP